jgi:MEMO1 family protein
MGVRKAAVAGTFYPDNDSKLRAMFDQFFERCKKSAVKPKAIIVPHAGYVYSGIVAAAGYALAKEVHCEKYIILGPSHRLRFNGAAFDNNEYWETPLGNAKVANFYAEHIKVLPQAHVHEHSIEVQVPFIQYLCKDGMCTIAPIALGSAAPIRDDVLQALDDKTLLIVSSDLSHYLDYETATQMDKHTIEKILNLRYIDYEEACGADGINTLINVARKMKWKPVLIDYRTSGDTARDKYHVVGYACIAFT